MSWLINILEDARRGMQQRPLWAGGDPRWHAMLARFRQLNTMEILRVLNNRHRMCFDTWNYDEDEGTFCPIAIAMNIHALGREWPTDSRVRLLIKTRFPEVNILKGTPGNFYRKDRRGDLTYLCNFLLKERGE